MNGTRELRLKRAKEREAFEHELGEKFYFERERHDELFDYNLAQALQTYLKDRALGFGSKDIESAEVKRAHPNKRNAHVFFVYILLPKISAFKDTDEEMDVIIATLLGEVTRSIQRPLFLKLGIALGY